MPVVSITGNPPNPPPPPKVRYEFLSSSIGPFETHVPMIYIAALRCMLTEIGTEYTISHTFHTLHTEYDSACRWLSDSDLALRRGMLPPCVDSVPKMPLLSG